jgi:hypothetical protein
MDNIQELIDNGATVTEVRNGRVVHVFSKETILENMARVGDIADKKCRGGLALFIQPRDHDNPHVEVWWSPKRQELAKIYFYPALSVAKKPQCQLSENEIQAITNWFGVASNMLHCRKEWYRIHKNNPAANNPFDEKGEIIK